MRRATPSAVAAVAAAVAGLGIGGAIYFAVRRATEPSCSSTAEICSHGSASSALSASSASSASSSRSPDPSLPWAKCAGVDCRTFAAPEDAFRVVLAGEPRVLGVGESHALAGGANVPSATKRFTDGLLPLLSKRASDLVVEVMLPNPACAHATETARQKQKVVTSAQAPSDQNEFVGLARAAERLGITPHPLRPSCEDLSLIGAAGPDAVLTSLTVVTRLLSLTTERLLAGGRKGMIVVYGGALHNDAAPDAEHAAWSYAPALSAATHGRYVELDLVVPEFVKDTPPWQRLPWFDAFRRAPHPKEATLYRTLPNSYTLLFARSE